MSLQHNAFQHNAFQSAAASGAAAGETFRQPLAVRILAKPRLVAQALVVTNLLLTTLVAPVQAGKASFPASLTRPSAHAAIQAMQIPTRFGLDVLSLNPFYAEETAPTHARATRQSVHNPPSLNLTTLEVAAGPPPFVQGDWANPIRARKVQTPISFRPDVDPATPPPAEGTPFIPPDLPQPRKRVIRTLSIGVPAFDRMAPFIQTDWSNPTARRVAQQPSIPPVFDRTAVVVDPPFKQVSWENPQRHRVRQAGDQIQAIDRTPIVVQSPFIQTDWANPTRRVVSREWGSFSPLQYSAFIVVPEKPYNISDWPNPTLRVLPREWGQQLSLNYQEFVDTPIPPEPDPPTVIIYGGDDAPRKKKRKEAPREDFFKAIERSIHALLHPEEVQDTQDESRADTQGAVNPSDLERQYQALVGLAEDNHRSLQALGVIRQEIDAYIAKREQEERDDEEFLMMS